MSGVGLNSIPWKKGKNTKDCSRRLCADELLHAAGKFELQGPHQGNWGRRLNVERQSTTNVGRAHVEERRPPRFFEIRAGFARSACLGTGRTDTLPAPFLLRAPSAKPQGRAVSRKRPLLTSPSEDTGADRASEMRHPCHTAALRGWRDKSGCSWRASVRSR